MRMADRTAGMRIEPRFDRPLAVDHACQANLVAIGPARPDRVAIEKSLPACPRIAQPLSGRPIRIAAQAAGMRIETRFVRPLAAGDPREASLVAIGRAGLDCSANENALSA